MAGANILIVEDDATIARFVELELTHAGFDVRKATDGKLGLDAVAEAEPDLLILDLMLPEIDGLEVARRLRAEGRTFPILMLTARAETQDLVTGFDAGADDYLRKPFEIPELLSRVRALLKRTEQERTGPSHTASGVEVDSNSRRATVDGETIELTAKEFDLLYYLVTNAGRVISRDEILKAVWGGQHATDSNVIEVFVCHLRNKIGDRDNTIIQTIRGVGYFFARG
ncbi:MAG: DNA-binding response regulator [Actinobacteria bacterium HGW-Actinobacteria-9]|nr:MAG: DNA-binding response regulator [Actinobacteria bacterium HGW-Actinobacteria-9]